MSDRRGIILLVVLSVLLLGIGFSAGRFLTVRELERAHATRVAEITRHSVLNEAPMPERDVTGEDIPDLPRYPGSVRVEFRDVIVGDLAEIEVEYVVLSDLDSVHAYYRQVFDDYGWIVADLGIYQGEWTFLVVSGEREAIVELEARQSIVEIEIELTEPISR